MSPSASPPNVHASTERVFPLSLFDEVFEVGIAMAWVVEGRVDITRITSALDNITARWPMLAGRIERGEDVGAH